MSSSGCQEDVPLTFFLDGLFFAPPYIFNCFVFARELCLMPVCSVHALSLAKKNGVSHPKVWAYPLVP